MTLAAQRMPLFRIGAPWDIPPRVLHRGLVKNPDTAVTAGSSEYIAQVRYSGTVLRLTLHSTHNPGTVSQGFLILLKSKNALTVTSALVGEDTGEDVDIQGSGTNEVEISSELSGVAGVWSLANQNKRVDLTISGNADGARCRIVLWGGDIGSSVDPVLDTVYWGESEMDSQIDIDGSPIAWELWLQPQLIAGQIEDGSIGTAQLAGGAVTDAKVTSIGAAKIAESASRKWAGETGADVTATNTAAGITGQGALATANTVGSSEIDNGAVVEAKIGTGAVTNVKYGNASITQDKIDDDAVGLDELEADAVFGAAFTSGVQLALIDYNIDDGPDTQAAWDLV